MPVSHLGLSVSHLPAASSFYLSALQPLGYRYFGNQGNAIGLGVHEADFFLSPAPAGVRPTPTHVAFHAGDCVTVRDCYNAAIQAGGVPSGQPGFLKDDCNCFNAAVEDPDGNTIEFIWRERPMTIRSKTYSPQSDSEIKSSGLQRARTEPIGDFSSKTFIGTMLGVAAGAAVAYAMARGERDSSRAEHRWSQSRADDRYETMRSRARTADYGSHRRSSSAATGDRSQRGYAAIDAAQRVGSSRLIMPASKSYADDNQVEYTRQRVTRTASGRSHTYETMDVGPPRRISQRSTTMPIEHSPRQIEGYGSRRSSHAEVRTRHIKDQAETGSRYSASHTEVRSRHDVGHTGARSRHDSVVSGHSQRKIEPAYTSGSQASTVKPSRRGSVHTESAARVALPPSVVSRTSKATSKPKSSFDAYYLPVDTPNDVLRDDQVDDDGLDDLATIVPDDSISCIGLPRTSSKAIKTKQHRSDRRDDDKRSRVTVEYRPVAATVPSSRIRDRDQYARHTYSTLR